MTIRVAPLKGEASPSSTVGRRKDGDVWVRWANNGNRAGWYAVGTREPSGYGFWPRTLSLAVALGNERLDAVHSIGPGVLSVGGMAVTMASGMAQDLLSLCLERHPIRWMECMAPVLREHGALRVLGFERENPMENLEQVREKKIRALQWVESCSRLLRDARFDAVQEEFLRTRGTELLDSNLRRRLHLGHDMSHVSQEQQALCAVAVVLALSDPDAASETIWAAISDSDSPQDNGPADAALRALHRREDSGQRLRAAMGMLPALFAIGPR